VGHHRHLVIGRYDQHFEELLPLEKSPVEFLRSAYDLTEQVIGKKTKKATQSTTATAGILSRGDWR